MATAAATTEKSRYLREIQEIREQLNRATVAGERDQELKAKVFNDAKAEVMTLNKRVIKFDFLPLAFLQKSVYRALF